MVKTMLLFLFQGRNILEREAILNTLNTARRSLIRLIISFAVVASVSYSFWKEILVFMQRPIGMPLVYYGIPEAFLASVSIALITGIFLSIPFIFSELWNIISPFFIRDSGRYYWVVVLSATLLFYSGAAICYFLLLPAGVQFLIGYETGHIKPFISVSSYISFVSAMVFGFGGAFEMPLVMILLGRAGIVDAALLIKYRRYAILIIVIASAIITPTPDLLNLSLMSVPLYALYEISIILVRLFGAPRKTAKSEL